MSSQGGWPPRKIGAAGETFRTYVHLGPALDPPKLALDQSSPPQNGRPWTTPGGIGPTLDHVVQGWTKPKWQHCLWRANVMLVLLVATLVPALATLAYKSPVERALVSLQEIASALPEPSTAASAAAFPYTAPESACVS